MVRENRVKSYNTGSLTVDAAGEAFHQSTLSINGRLWSVAAYSDVEGTIVAGPRSWSGNSVFDYFELDATGDTLIYPKIQNVDESGTSISGTFSEILVRDRLNVYITGAPTGSSISVELRYI